MRTYETNSLTGKQADTFKEWFDREIGTDIDQDDDGEGGHVITCFELTANEVSKCRYFETKKIDTFKQA